MTKQLVLKPEKCVDCRTCELICSFEHNGVFNPTLSAVTVFDYAEDVVTVPVMCLQCDEASCAKVCPVHAIKRTEAGEMAIDYNKCIVCKLCVQACPMGNVSYSPLTHKVFKCDLCGGDPQCARFCPPGAIQFVDPADDLDRKKAVAEGFRVILGEEVA
ncbi:MAG: 4Fe-4S dicluster domain-containing protein [Coriobacteriales bacterium]|jgi:Fe-S-cluster-containing hydrogenase component 2|nr:4Fe-4S dicluster domain-containing protein [Coriobacteriales bacterium]